MTNKRAVLYGATVLLLALLVYLVWPGKVSRLPGAESVLLAKAKRGEPGASGLGAVIRSSTAGRKTVAVSGTVRDVADAKGIGGVVLSFRSPVEAGPARSNSALNGEYRLELSTGLYEVALQAEQHAMTSLRASVLIQEGEPVTGLDFWLQRSGSVGGRVVDIHGKPVAGAQVKVQAPHAGAAVELSPPVATSDQQGRFSIQVAPGQVLLRAEASEIGAAVSRPVYVKPGMQVSGVEIVLGAGGTMAGLVLRPDSVPVSGAEVAIRDELGTRRIHCDPQGSFTATALTPGIKLVQAIATGFAPSQVTEQMVQIGAPRVELKLQLGIAKGVAGRVVSPEGAPVPRAKVTVTVGGPRGPLLQVAPSPESLTDEEGRFQFRDVPDLPLTLTARAASGMATTKPGVAPGALNVMLKLEAMGRIIGRLTESRGGRPLRDFTVTVTAGPGIGEVAPGASLRVASTAGRFSLDDLLPGRYSLVFSAPGFGPVEKSNISVNVGQATRADAALDGAGRIGGVVVDSRGVGVPGATVRVETGWFGPAVVTDASGSFLISDVARGQRSLSVSHPQYHSRLLGGITVYAGETASARVELNQSQGGQPGRSLSGIGITLGESKGRVRVVEPLTNSPGEVAGLRAGDQLLAINGQDVAGMGFREAAEALRGVAGTPVRVVVQRGGQRVELFIIRAEVTFPGKR